MTRLPRLPGTRPERPLALADDFDFIGGTGTGPIIAAGLAPGMRAQQLGAPRAAHCPAAFDLHG